MRNDIDRVYAIWKRWCRQLSRAVRRRGAVALIDQRNRKTYAQHCIGWAAAGRVMTIALHGFWNGEDAAAYTVALREAVGRTGGHPFDLVVDVSDLAAQSQETILAYGGLAALIGVSGVRRLIIVNVAPLLLMQFRRAASTLPFERAASMAEAQAMLRGERPEPHLR